VVLGSRFVNQEGGAIHGADLLIECWHVWLYMPRGRHRSARRSFFHELPRPAASK
jgi:hypothetical protein